LREITRKKGMNEAAKGEAGKNWHEEFPPSGRRRETCAG